MEITLHIEDGTARAIYSDEVADALQSAGQVTVTRASHVEPATYGGWYADMRPSDGPILFANTEIASFEDVTERPVGFPTRAEALAAEVNWLRAHRGL